MNVVDHRSAPPGPPPPEPTVAELAERLRPVRLVDGYEYRLAEPDYVVAEKILAMKTPPPTEPHAPTAAAPVDVPGADGGQLRPRWVFTPDDRTQSAYVKELFPSSATGHLGFPPNNVENCTASMIGRTTSITAAHCVYDNGAWISTTGIAWAANNLDSPPEPYGRWQPTYTVLGNWAAYRDWNYDFAVVEWAPYNAPGDQVGWLGAEYDPSGYQELRGYSRDKPQYSQWLRYGWYSSAYDGRYKHYIDAVGGDSGGCYYNISYRCTGIQSTQAWDGGGFWNEARRWDSTTYNFFDTYGAWP